MRCRGRDKQRRCASMRAAASPRTALICVCEQAVARARAPPPNPQTRSRRCEAERRRCAVDPATQQKLRSSLRLRGRKQSRHVRWPTTRTEKLARMSENCDTILKAIKGREAQFCKPIGVAHLSTPGESTQQQESKESNRDCTPARNR
eukprot:5952427-Pleurochrysis_carterae.AAC.2